VLDTVRVQKERVPMSTHGCSLKTCRGAAERAKSKVKVRSASNKGSGVGGRMKEKEGGRDEGNGGSRADSDKHKAKEKERIDKVSNVIEGGSSGGGGGRGGGGRGEGKGEKKAETGRVNKVRKDKKAIEHSESEASNGEEGGSDEEEKSHWELHDLDWAPVSGEQQGRKWANGWPVFAASEVGKTTTAATLSGKTVSITCAADNDTFRNIHARAKCKVDLGLAMEFTILANSMLADIHTGDEGLKAMTLIVLPATGDWPNCSEPLPAEEGGGEASATVPHREEGRRKEAAKSNDQQDKSVPASGDNKRKEPSKDPTDATKVDIIMRRMMDSEDELYDSTFGAKGAQAKYEIAWGKIAEVFGGIGRSRRRGGGKRQKQNGAG
jgi:hypothetical protein